MVKIVPIQEAYKRKIERQEKVEGLKFMCHGSCAFIGKDISPGCYGCFYSDAYYCGFMLGRDLGLPNICNRDCVYCFSPHRVDQSNVVSEEWQLSEEWKSTIFESMVEQQRMLPSACNMQYYEFTGICEPLLYLPVLRELMGFLRNVIDTHMGTRGWAKIYTNGTLLNEDNVLKLADMGFDEVRVHPGASNFSQEVYNNMRLAVKHIPTVTVETPAWPPHREKLFRMLPIIEDIGIEHVDICQIEIANGDQLKRIENALVDIEIYQAFYPVMDDNGLVEDIMAEVIKQDYSYSVLDCNGFVKQSKSSLSSRSYWNLLNRKYPDVWEKHRRGRQLSSSKTGSV